ncbi:unnamed protein product [Pseudo-nitzschia multistriata]|uniref:Uncharacterized protein n=1 Tax=Pseudo-nitzschia multistriata TaxID=183589 RepID=A0A448Z6J7_9STRA|nr:unnamed protein product [Pseudo-nitzschia multistriata]
MNSTATVSTRARPDAMSGTMSEQDFQTPDRSTTKALSSVPVTGHPEEKKDDTISDGNINTRNVQSSATMVTPLDAFSTAAARKEASAAAAAHLDNKQVRFDSTNGSKNNSSAKAKAIEATTHSTAGSDEGDSSSSSTSSPSSGKRGLVSRRGGRCASPGRRSLLPSSSNGVKESPALEFQTFLTPARTSSSNRNKEKKSEEESSSGETIPSHFSANSTDRKESDRENKNYPA